MPMSGSAREKQVRRHFCIAAAAAVSLAGCTSIGPRSVAVDRFDYSTAIADSWKE